MIREAILEALRLARTGRSAAAKELLTRLETTIRTPEVDHCWARVLTLSGEPNAAIERFRRYLKAVPADYRARGSLAAALASQGKLAAARRELEVAIETAPPQDQALILTDYANALLRTPRRDEASAAYQRAVALCPTHPHMRLNLAAALSYAGRTLPAIYHFAVAQSLEPGLIETDAADYLENHLQALIGLAESPERQKSNAARLARQRCRDVIPLPAPPSRPAGDRLRIGYVSPDFRQHAVAMFFAPVLAAHDRSKVAVRLYGEVRHPDAVTERLRQLADGWLTTCGLAADELATRIRGDDIDVLVDLAGWTGGSRLDAFVYRPAPVQLTWLGYAATTGLNADTGLDGRITDRWADPPTHTESHFTERLFRLPSGFLAYRPLSEVPLALSFPAERNGHVTFGSFNNAAKISDATVALWTRTVNAVPMSRLQLKNHALDDPYIRQETAARFARAGLAVDRITMRPPTKNMEDHLRAYDHIDIALDTFPYHGTTTTCEALWMGVPVVSLIGQTHASRVGLSILTRAGLEDLTTTSPDEFVANVVRLAHDRPRLAHLRAGLRAQICESPLFDPAQIARDLETLYAQLTLGAISGELSKPT